MTRRLGPLLIHPFGGATLILGTIALATMTSRPASAAPQTDQPMEVAIGGVGGLYLLAEPGELWVEIEKRDRARPSRHTELRAILVGPDRQVCVEKTIPYAPPPKGQAFGPPQRVRLATRVPLKGVYAVNITVSQDRYGDAMVWGFRTNCEKYLVETSRGHRDQRREEPIVLAGKGRSATIAFVPRQAAFGIEIESLPPLASKVELRDAQGKLLSTIPVESGKAAASIPASLPRRDVPWQLCLPDQPATVQVDGVTRWDNKDRQSGLPCWTPHASSYFPFLDYRWLLTPYQRRVDGMPGQKGQLSFRVHNNSASKKTIRLDLEFPKAKWPVTLSTDRLTLSAGGAQPVVVTYTVPAEGEAMCHLRATPEESAEFTTYSTLRVRASAANAPQKLTMPLVLRPYQHENEQFGYLPDYPTESQVYFDPANRPFVRTTGGVATWRDGQWTTTNVRDSVRSQAPGAQRAGFGLASTKVAFDREGDVYILGTSGRGVALLHSKDHGRSFTAYPIPESQLGSRHYDIEVFTGHNQPAGPPPILSYTLTATDPQRIWRRVNTLELLLPRKTSEGISWEPPVMVSKSCIGYAGHSGCPSSLVSRGDRVHLIWAEATDPEQKQPGVPTYVATYDRQSKKLSSPSLVGYGPPANDVHNTPSLTIDSRGFLHALAGTHGSPFPYARSLKPDDAGGGWTQAEPVGDKLSQTYIGLVCGPDDTLHLVSRIFLRDREPFPHSYHGTLAYQRKRRDGPWESPQTLIVPPFSEYSVYYHRLTIDHAGRLFVSYDYWSTFWFYRTDHAGSRRALLCSPDGGLNWKLATTGDLTR